MPTNKSAVAQLDIGQPDDAVRAIIDQIDAYAAQPAATEDDHIQKLRGSRLLRAYAYDAWLRVIAQAYYAPEGHVSLNAIGELNAGEKPMARSTVQHHAACGLELLTGPTREAVETEKRRRAELVVTQTRDAAVRRSRAAAAERRSVA